MIVFVRIIAMAIKITNYQNQDGSRTVDRDFTYSYTLGCQHLNVHLFIKCLQRATDNLIFGSKHD